MNIYLKPKIFRALKLSTLCLILGVEAGVATESYSQKTTFTISVQDQSVKEVFDYIEQHSEFIIFYLDETIDVNRKVSVNLKDQRVENILEQLFKNTDVTYTINDRQILLSKRKEVTEVAPVVAVVQQKKNTVTGVVLDPTGMPVIGANIMVKGTTIGTITDMDGKFSLDVDKDATLVISYIGFASQEIKVGNQTKLSIALKEDSEALDELVVVGYGTKTKATLTGSVSIIEDKLLENRPTTRMTDLLQGAAAGVQVTRGNSGRIKGNNSGISVRGFTSRYDPGILIVIDGIAQKDNNSYALDNINPDDVESISILKDAQAAIYGARASGGVMMVTTKKGHSEKPTINFSANYNIQVPDNLRKYLNILQIVEMQNEGFVNDGLENNMYTHVVKYIEDNGLTMDEIKKNNGKYYCQWPFDNTANFVFGDYDWYDIMWSPAPIQTYNLSISGNTKKINYYNSIGYVDQQSMLNYAKNENKRLFAKLKNDYQITDFLKIKSMFDFERQYVVEPTRYSGGWNSAENQQGLVWPVFMPYNSKGHYYNFGSHENPIGYAKDSGSNADINYRIKALLGFDLIPFENFKLTGEYSSSWDMRENEWSYLGFDMYNENDVYSYNSTNNRNSAGRSFGRSRYTVANLYANYNFSLFQNHNIGIMVGGSHEEEDYVTFAAERRLGQIDQNLPTMGVGSSEEQYNSEYRQDLALSSVFSRIDWSYKNKYMLEGIFRYDGSSRFAKNHRWTPFWGVSGAWLLSSEEFMRNTSSWLSFAKIRLSWGQMGNQAGIGLYDYISQINIGGSYPMGNSLAPSKEQSATLGGMSSTSRTWETIETFNTAVDLSFLDSRLNATLEYYIKNNSNMFYNKEYPQVLGTTSPSINGAKARTKGWDLSLNWKDKIKEVGYSISFNLSDNRNRVIELAENAIPSLGTNGYIEGYPVGSYFGYKFNGFIQDENDLKNYNEKISNGGIPNTLKPGDAKYVDMDGDGKLVAQAYQLDENGNPTKNSGDLICLGDNGQHYLLGLNLGLNWRNIDFSAFFQGVMNWKVFESNYSIEHWAIPSQEYFYHNTWTPDNKTAKYPRLSQDDGVKAYNYLISDAPYKLINNRYIRLKNLQIGYTFSNVVLHKIKVQKFRVYFSGSDLFELKEIPKMYDPEKPFYTRITPMPRGYSFGINLTL